MKAIKIILIILLLTQVSLFGQNTASASFTASVTIIEPIEIKTTSNMNFASIDARQGGSVILSPDDTRTATGDIELKSSNGLSAAVFEVKGHNGYSYDIIIPNGEFIMTNGSEKVVLKDFKAFSASKTLDQNSQTIRMGATLEVGAQQKPGNYITPAPLEITVSYN